MKYPIAPLFVRPWTLNGISPKLIESHYEVNYGGTVRRLNAIAEQLAFLDRKTTPAEVIHRLKRDEFTGLNSMLLHELYFASIGGDGRAVPACRFAPSCSPECSSARPDLGLRGRYAWMECPRTLRAPG